MRKRICNGRMEFRQSGHNGKDAYICNICGRVLLSSISLVNEICGKNGKGVKPSKNFTQLLLDNIFKE